MQHHAFVIAAEAEEGIRLAEAWVTESLKLTTKNNPDVLEFRYGLFSVEDARKVANVVSHAPLRGDQKAVIIAANRLYHEAQNALLKVFEEPPKGTFLFLIVPSIGMLLPTLRSRVHLLAGRERGARGLVVSEEAEAFIRASKEKRTAIIKKLSTGKDEDERRENRDRAIGLVNGIEAAAYAAGVEKQVTLLTETATLRGYLHDRSAPLKMILEHLSLVLPKNLL